MSDNPKNLPNAERLYHALRHLVTCIEEAPDGQAAKDLPLTLARAAITGWRGGHGTFVVPVAENAGKVWRVEKCPTCDHTTALEAGRA